MFARLCWLLKRHVRDAANMLLQIGNPIHRTDKRIIWVDGGIHAREWAAVHTALYFIDQVCSSALGTA